jgi:hypothetical protein
MIHMYIIGKDFFNVTCPYSWLFFFSESELKIKGKKTFSSCIRIPSVFIQPIHP